MNLSDADATLGLSEAKQDAPDDWLKNLFDLRRVDAKSASKYLSQSAFYKAGRWMLPEAQHRTFFISEPKEPPDGDIDSQIQYRFMDIFNDILDYFSFGDTRKVLATQPTDDEWNDSHFNYDKGYTPPSFSTRPDLVLLGHDPKFLPRALETYSRSMSVGVEKRRDLYRGCVAIGKVQRSTRWNEMDMMLEKVATCARECFLHQPGRRFVYCFSLNPEFFQLFLFDRNGIVRSKSLDIHKGAIQLVQAIRMLAGANLAAMCFDPAIYWEDGVQFVSIVNRDDGMAVTVKCELHHVISQKTAISGPGTLCWALRKPGQGDLFVMKDMWRKDGDAREEELLTSITRAGISGVTQLRLIDQTHSRCPLSIASLRQGQGLTSAVSDNRTFSRLIFKDAGPSICDFKSDLQVLQALRAAMETHRCLVKADFLHRDISPTHILLGNQERGRPSGVLIDFSLATPCVNGKTPADNDTFIGSLHFRSVNNIEAACFAPSDPNFIRKRHSFIDDLEAFFWVYTWIILSQDGPGVQNARFNSCSFLSSWKDGTMENISHLEALKGVRLSEDSRSSNRGFIIAPYFSQPAYLNLYHSLRHFCRSVELERNISSAGVGEKDFFLGIDTMYGEALSLFDAAIEEVSKENHSAHNVPLAPCNNASTKQTSTIPLPPLFVTHVLAPLLNSALPAPLVIPTARPPARTLQPKGAKQCRIEEESTDFRGSKKAKSILPRRSERLKAAQTAMHAGASNQPKVKAPGGKRR